MGKRTMIDNKLMSDFFFVSFFSKGVFPPSIQPNKEKN